MYYTQLIVFIKVIVYGWDFCGPNNDFYAFISIVFGLQISIEFFWLSALRPDLWRSLPMLAKYFSGPSRAEFVRTDHSIFSQIFHVWNDQYAQTLHAMLDGILIGEISNPFLQTNLLLEARGVLAGKFAWINNTLLFATWMICRYPHAWFRIEMFGALHTPFTASHVLKASFPYTLYQACFSFCRRFGR